MALTSQLTAEEIAFGFEVVEHALHGRMAIAHIGDGLRALKMERDGIALYAICDASLIVLYEPAHSLFDLRRRFANDRRSA